MTTEGIMDIQQIRNLMTKPTPFERVGQLIWTDMHVSRQLLAAHLDPSTDAASRRPETIDNSVAWILDVLQLKSGMALLDLGCGPGLYCQRFAKAGLMVTGIDFSVASLSHAREQALAANLCIDYRLQSYLEFCEVDCFDAVLLIYGDYCALAPAERKRLLEIVHQSLHEGGRFVLDVTTRECRKKYGLKNGWHTSEGGFWSSKKHLVLEQGFDYPEEMIYLDQFIVIDEDDNARIFRNWFQDFSNDLIEKELSAGGFKILGTYSDLLGSPLLEGSEWIGIVAKREDLK